jgi:hypothetical protein
MPRPLGVGESSIVVSMTMNEYENLKREADKNDPAILNLLKQWVRAYGERQTPSHMATIDFGYLFQESLNTLKRHES